MRATNPFFRPPPPLHHTGQPHVAFSRVEVVHLVVAVLALSYAFAVVFQDDRSGLGAFYPGLKALGIAFLAVATGFVLHELAHKVVAQHYGHWAEFRAQFAGLVGTVVIAALTGFLFAAPGAVLIQGRVTPRENGLISLVGPGANFLLALAAYPFAWHINPDDSLRVDIAHPVAQVNAILCVFNLLPFGPLDGRKIWYWSKAAYIAALLAAITLVYAVIAFENQLPFTNFTW
jgi:Zn-dependent protease